MELERVRLALAQKPVLLVRFDNVARVLEVVSSLKDFLGDVSIITCFASLIPENFTYAVSSSCQSYHGHFCQGI